jgi:hypothetical protein
VECKANERDNIHEKISEIPRSVTAPSIFDKGFARFAIVETVLHEKVRETGHDVRKGRGLVNVFL